MEGVEALRGLLFIWFVGLVVTRYRRRKKLNLAFWTRRERIGALVVYVVVFLLIIGLLVKDLGDGRFGQAAGDTFMTLGIFVGIPYLTITGARDKRRFAAAIRSKDQEQ